MAKMTARDIDYLAKRLVELLLPALREKQEDERLISVGEAGKLLGMSHTKFWQLRRDGKISLTEVSVDGNKRFLHSEVVGLIRRLGNGQGGLPTK